MSDSETGPPTADIQQIRLPACTVDLTARRAVFGSPSNPDARTERLTAREVEVLRYFAARPGQLVRRQALEREVWNFAASVRSEAVPVAIRRLRGRIERDPKDPEALVTDYGEGWRLHVQPPESPPSTTTALPPSVQVPIQGREAEREELLAGWESHTVQTLTGPGGVGKTTLARAVSPAGTVFVDLQAATTRADVIAAIQHAVPTLKFSGLAPDAILERVRLALAPAPLVVLDNAEQVLDPVRWVVGQLTGTRLLVTSRERLGVTGERVVPLAPLPADDAGALFIRRYTDSGGRTALDPEEVAALVEDLDGLPLAIELVAPRARLIPIPALRERLTGGLDAIPASATRPARHASIRACLDWSWESLTTEAHDVLRATACFGGTFDVDGLTQLTGGDPFDVLEDLFEHSLLVSPQPGRFRLLTLVRAYVDEQGVPDALRTAHARWVLEHAEAVLDDANRQIEMARWIAELVQVVRAAWDPEQIVRAAVLVARFRYASGLSAGSRDIVDLAESRIGRTDDRLTLQRLHAMARLDAHAAGALAASVEVQDPMLRLELIDVRQLLSAHRIGTPPDLESWRELLFSLDEPTPFKLGTFALRLIAERRTDEAIEVAQQAVDTARAWGERSLARSLRILAVAGRDRHGRDWAEAHLRESLRAAEQSGDRTGIVVSRWELAQLIAHRDRRVADEAFAEAAAGLQSLSGWPTRARAIASRATNAWWLGEAARARTLFADVDWEYLDEDVVAYWRMFETLAANEVGEATDAQVTRAVQAMQQAALPDDRPARAVLGAILEHLAFGTPLPESLDTLIEPLGDPPWTADITTAVARVQASETAR